VQREEAQRLKDEKATEHVEAQVRKAAKRQNGLRMKATRAVKVASARAAKPADKELRAVE
jgi:hypothetical protein